MKSLIPSLLLLVLYGQALAKTKDIHISAAYLPENVEQNGTTGREVLIIKAVTSCMGMSTTIEVNPYFRHLKLFTQNNRFDAVISVPASYQLEETKTVAHVYYHNGAIVRANDSKSITKKEDLRGKHVVAFKGAKNLLLGLKELIPTMASYMETTEQFNHNKMLMKKRIDVVLSDGLIFMAHHKRLFPDQLDSVIFKPLFKAIPFHVAFRDSRLTTKFNECFKKLQNKGTIREINKRFINHYKTTLGNSYLGL